MLLAPYRALLAQRNVRTLLLFGVLARIPHTGAALVLTLHVVTTLDRGYAAAGWVAAAFTVGAAAGAPWRGREVDRLGLRRALVPSIVGETAVFGTAGFLPYPWLLVAAFLGGVFVVPIFTVMRQSLSVMVAQERRRTAYAVDSIGVELSFMAGPAVAVAVATIWGTQTGLLAVAAAGLLAGAGLWLFNPPTRSDQLDRRLRQQPLGELPETAAQAAAGVEAGTVDHPGSREHSARPRARTWASPALLGVLAATSGATLVLYGTDVGVIAQLREMDAISMTGVVFLFWGTGSIAGALVYGQAKGAPHPLWLLLGLAACTAPVGLAHSLWALCLAITVAGALCAPVITATAEAVARLVPEGSRGVAMGWHGSALTLGGAVGAPLAGASIDSVGPWGGFVSVAVLGALLALTGLAAQRVRAYATGPVSFSPGP